MSPRCAQAIRLPMVLAVISSGSLLTVPAPAAEGTTVKRIYLAPDDHTDYMWTLDEEGYRRAFLEMLDYYLDQIDATANNPPPYQARWNCDGSFWLWTYERNKPAQDFERLIVRVRDGHISVPLTALASCYGGQPAEAVLRGMYYAGSLERRYQLRFPLALAIEDQTMPFGLGALWAGAGAKYSWRGICACASRMRDAGDRAHDIYWWKGADGSRILMKWNSLLTNNQSLGGYAEARDPFGVVDLVDNDPRFQRRWPYPVIGAFGKGWDDAKTLTNEFIRAAQSKTTGRRQVIVSNEEDFFRDFEATCGAQIPELSAGFGNEWDLYSASLAEVTARVRRAVEKLRNAEAMATLVSLQRPDFARNRAAARDQAWMNLGLYWEHDWTADGKAIGRETRAAWQRRLAEQIESYVYSLHADATQALGAMIRLPGTKKGRQKAEDREQTTELVELSPGGSVKAEGLGDGSTTSAGSHRQASLDAATQNAARPRFFAFNSLGWTRTDVADLPWSGAEPVHVVDVSSGRQTPSQRVTVNGGRCLRVLAPDVPPVGYKVFEIRPGPGEKHPDAATVTGNVIENSSYRITVAERGAITSLIDKTRGNREFTAQIDGRALNDLGPGSGRLEVENAGPVSVTLLALSTEPLVHTSRVTLIRDSRRIEIDNAITQNFGDVRTWGFAFNLEDPDVWHEEVGAVIRAKLLGQGGHYSPRNARYDWLTMNHFVDMGGKGEVGVALANGDCGFLQLGHSTVARLDTATPLIAALIGGQVDGPKLGIPDQGGDRYFRQRFALQTRGRFNPVEAMRFALEHQNPLVAGLVTGGALYPQESFSLLKVTRPELFLWAVKPAEEGIDRGVIVRLWNMAHHPVQGEIEFGRAVRRALRTTHLETDLSEVPLIDGRLPVSPAAQQLRTYRLAFARP
jgi:alpha-mannosidase